MDQKRLKGEKNDLINRILDEPYRSPSHDIIIRCKSSDTSKEKKVK